MRRRPLDPSAFGSRVCPACGLAKTPYSGQCRPCDLKSRNGIYFDRESTERLWDQMRADGIKLTEKNSRKLKWRGDHGDFYTWRGEYLEFRGLEPSMVVGEAGRTRVPDYPVMPVPMALEAKPEPAEPAVPAGIFAPLVAEHFRAWRRICLIQRIVPDRCFLEI